jgi:hypothetical protein
VQAQLSWLEANARLFEGLASGCLLQRLAALQESARWRPSARGGRKGASTEQHFVGRCDDRVDQHAWVAVSDRSTLRADGARATLEFDEGFDEGSTALTAED